MTTLRVAHLTELWLLTIALSMQAQKIPNAIFPPMPPPESGARMFLTYCASCHGINGHGNGPSAKSLATTPADLTRLTRLNHGVFPSAWIAHVIQYGGPPQQHPSEMPAFGKVLGRAGGHDEGVAWWRIRSLVAYIESLQSLEQVAL